MATANIRWRRWLRLTPFKLGCVLIALAISLYAGFGGVKPALLQSLDNQLTTAMFMWRGPQPTTDQVVIVDIDEASLVRHGQWPWSRDLVAQLVEQIAAARPRVLGLDIVFAEPDRSSPKQVLPKLSNYLPSLDAVLRQPLPEPLDYDLRLGQALSTLPSVLGYPFQTTLAAGLAAGESPWPSATIQLVPDTADYSQLALPKARRAVINIADVALGESEGFFNVFPDRSGTVRRVPLIMAFQTLPYPSLALEMVRIGHGQQVIRLHSVGSSQRPDRRGLLGVEVGERFLPTDDRGQVTVNYRGPSHSFRYLSAAEVLAGHHHELLRDRYVLLGTSAAGLLDLRATPFSSVVPGVEIHATIIDNVLQGDLFAHDRLTEAGLTVSILLVGGLLLSACLAFGGPVSGGLSGLLLLAAVLVGNYQLFFLRHIQLGLIYPLLSFGVLFVLLTLYNYFYSTREKRFIHGAFGQYVSPQVVSELVKNPAKLTLSGEQKELSVLFSDIRNFTTLSEQMDTIQLAGFMNDYLSVMSDIVMAEQGMVDKYIGDAIMAMWGAPLEDDQHAARAVRCALRMIEALAPLNDTFAARGLPVIDIGIGINTGLMQVGNFGSAKRFNYTVLGDHVNLSSRLEGLNKNYGTRLLISEYTRRQIGESFCCRLIDRVRVKGKSQAVAIYEPLVEGALESAAQQRLQDYHQALELYRQQDFAAALERFSALVQDEPLPLYRLYGERCRHYLEQPPCPEWDGVASYSEK